MLHLITCLWRIMSPLAELFLFFSRKQDNISYKLSSICIGDNLHEISNPVVWEKQEKYHQFVVC